MGRLSIIFLLLMISCRVTAIPAYPHPVEVRQPDGSKMLLLIRGDEMRRDFTNIMGDRVVRGRDGFFKPTFELQLPQKSAVYSVKPASAQSISALIIPVEFKDVKFKIEDPRGHFDNMMNQEGYSDYDATGSVSDYFNANLTGERSLRFDVSEVVSLDNDLVFYGQNKENVRTNGVIYDAGIVDMVKEACDKIKGVVNFSIYQYVFIYFAGYSEAEGGDPDSIWPSSIDISHSPIIYNGARIETVGCGSELKGATGTIPSGIGAFCHEFGHVLGLPDLYDVDYDNNGRSKGMWGTLSLMDYGCYNNQGRTPPYLNAIEREILGGQAKYLTLNTLHHLEPINQNGSFYRVNTYCEDEYYLIEARQEMGWDSYIGGEGMLVYHIDKSSREAGQIQASVRWETNLINANSKHECADLVESVPSAVNVKQVFFPGLDNITTFATLTDPHFVDWDKRGVGLKMVDIRLNPENGGVSFMVKPDEDEILVHPVNVRIRSEQRRASVSWAPSMDLSAKWGLRWREKDKEFSAANEGSTDANQYTIENLRGGRTYECEIFHIGYRKNGDTLTVNFKTDDVTSSFPYIKGLERPVMVGDSVMLGIYNIVEVEDEILWYLNGEPVENALFVFSREGKNRVEAKIRYMLDNSVETITRIVYVGIKKEEEVTDGEI